MNILKNKSGFSLVELVVVITLITILSAVAIPLYTAHIANSRRSEGVAATLSVLTAAKTYYQDNNNSFVGASLANLDVNVSEPQSHWNIAVAPTANQIVITATGTGRYAGLTAALTYTVGTPSTTIIVDESGTTIFD